jgi:hypothetical protein
MIEEELVFCNNTFTLEATPSDPNNSFLWTCISCGSGVTLTDQTNFITDVTVTDPGDYTFIFQEDLNNVCFGTISVDVTIIDGLEIENLDFDCDIDGNYQVSFDIESGTGPYTVNGINITGNTFTSTSLLNGSNYSFDVIDAEGCTDLLEGSFDCPCTTDAGTMSDDEISICLSSGEMAIGQFNDDASFDSNDIGYFVLHTNDDDDLGFILATNETGNFPFDPNTMIPGETYYISYVVGNDLLGLIDYDDTCTSVSFGQAIIFWEDPDVFAGDDLSVCGLEVTLGDDSNYSGEWTLISGPTDAQVALDEQGDLVDVTVDIFGDYIFELEAEENNCFSTDQVTVTFSSIPMELDLSSECQNGQYQIQFTIEGGEAPYFVNGNLVDGNTFVSEFFNSGEEYTFLIEDENTCLSELIEGVVNCDCETEPGTMSGETILLCPLEGELFQANYNNNGVIGPDQIGLFVVHTSSSNILGDILAISEDGSFIYDPIFGDNTTLYISFVVANEDNGNLDFDDPCLAVSLGQELEILELVITSSGQDIQLCENQVTLAAETSGVDGFWEIIDLPNNAVIVLESIEGDSVNLLLDSIGTYVLSWVPDSPCYITDTITIDFVSDLAIELTDIICSDDLQSYELTLGVSGGSGTYIYNLDTIFGEIIIEDLIPDSVYQFVIEDFNGCTDTIDFIQNCSCSFTEASIGSDPLSICSNEDSLVLELVTQGTYVDGMDGVFVIHNGDSDSLGDILLISENNVFDAINTLDLNQELYISFVFDQLPDGSINYDDPCLAVSVGINLYIDDEILAIAGTDQVVCGLSTQLEGLEAGASISWELIESSISNVTISDVFSSTTELNVDDYGIVSLAYTVENGSCFDMDTVEISFVPPIEDPVFNEPDVICLSSDSLDIINLSEFIVSGNANGNWFIDNTPIDSNLFILDYEEGTYTLTYQIDDANCGLYTYELDLSFEPCPCPELLVSDLSICPQQNLIQLSDYLTTEWVGEWSIVEYPQGQNDITISDGELLISDLISGSYVLQFIASDQSDVCTTELLLNMDIGELPDLAEYINPGVICLAPLESIDLMDYIDNNTSGSFYSEAFEPISNTIIPLDFNALNVYYIIDYGLCGIDTIFMNIDVAVTDESLFEIQNVLCPGESDGQFIFLNDLDNVESLMLNGLSIELVDVLENLDPGQFLLDVFYTNSCIETIEFEIEDDVQFGIDLGDDIVLNDPSTIQFNLQTMIDSDDILNITWMQNGEIISNNNSTSVELSISDNAIISADLTDINGCVYTDELLVSVNIQEVDLVFANILNLNDPANSIFSLPENLAVDKINELSIFDRWGNEVYSAKDIVDDFETVFWDGRFNGQQVSTGVYVYFFEYTLNGRERRYSGDITVIN